jgi:S-adenosyl methyltransferase
VSHTPPTEGSDEASKFNPSVPHTARIWNYWLGGKDHFAADRAVGDQVRSLLPDIVTSARADRAFLARAVRFLVTEAGIRQFLDVGTGLPTANNTHEVAQAIAPECRIVYVDNDPLVLTHAQALLTSSPEGATVYVDADARDTDRILTAAVSTIDLDQPVAVMLLGILNFIEDFDEARGLVDRLMAAVPSGSYLAIAFPPRRSTPRNPSPPPGAGTRPPSRRSICGREPTWNGCTTGLSCSSRVRSRAPAGGPTGIPPGSSTCTSTVRWAGRISCEASAVTRSLVGSAVPTPSGSGLTGSEQPGVKVGGEDSRHGDRTVDVALVVGNSRCDDTVGVLDR